MKASADDLRYALQRFPRAGGADLCRTLGISPPTLSRLMAQLGERVVRLGGSKRTRYALRRALRGSFAPLPLYRIDADGRGQEVGTLSLVHSQGSALSLVAALPWPQAPGPMQDGWYDGLPYPLVDMRPQGFLGRHFAHRYARVLGVPESLADWTDEDVVHALATLGHDQSGDLVLGAAAFEHHLAERATLDQRLLSARAAPRAYVALAEQAMSDGVGGSSAAGEFPKFTAVRELEGAPVSVIVKFSGAEDSAAVRRWADLLVCEHLALACLEETLGLPAARTRVHGAAGRTFLEVVRFDRVGAHGRRPLCSLAGLNDALLGLRGRSWGEQARRLADQGWLPDRAVEPIRRLWWFGRLIANTDMHDGNLSFFPGLEMAPAYDMLPMLYAPVRGGEVPQPTFTPALPLPGERDAWLAAAHGACVFWRRAGNDARVSESFRARCQENADRLEAALQGV
jgi:hypothetical protein